MNENVKKYVPYGAAAVGALLGNVLYKKYPKFGMIGRVLAVGAGVAGGYYVSKMIIDKSSSTSMTSTLTPTV
jgi:hypothetical protein